LGLDPERVNVNGGAIALGHPLGMSGARLVVSLLHELRRRGGRYGLATLCVGVGQGQAALFERTAGWSRMPKGGGEPTLPEGKPIFRPARLPVPPLRPPWGAWPRAPPHRRPRCAAA